MQILNWVYEHNNELFSLFLAVYTLLSIVTGLTKTPKDDEYLKKFFDFISFLKPKDVKGTVKVPLTSTEPKK